MTNKITLKNCPLTGIEIKNHLAEHERFRNPALYYRLDYEGKEYYLGLCYTLYETLTGDEEFLNRNKELKKWKEKLKTYLPIFFGELGKSNFSNFFGNNIHWDCKPPKEYQENNINIKGFVEDILATNNYPKTRKEKTNLILSKIKEEQTFEGEPIKMVNEFKYWARFYMANSSEFMFYLKQLEEQGLVDISDSDVSLTFKGLDYTEGLKPIDQTMIGDKEEMYDVGLSFAGEQRAFVEQVAEELKDKGVNVFYDTYEQTELWGKDLYQHLSQIYKRKCAYCIIFISKDYARKLWTRHELKSAQARAFEENREYILPVRFDSTEIPGLNDTVGYISAEAKSPQQIAALAIKKVRG